MLGCYRTGARGVGCTPQSEISAPAPGGPLQISHDELARRGADTEILDAFGSWAGDERWLAWVAWDKQAQASLVRGPMRPHLGWLVHKKVIPPIDLSDTDLSGADLSGADLCGAELPGVNLRFAHLAGADLEGANLICADMRGADLTGACCDRAVLYGADLRHARIHLVSMRHACLGRALWREADCVGVDLTGAEVWHRDRPLLPAREDAR